MTTESVQREVAAMETRIACIKTDDLKRQALSQIKDRLNDQLQAVEIVEARLNGEET